MDVVIQKAFRTALPLRAIICDGTIRDLDSKTGEPPLVKKRILDSSAWRIEFYDVETGRGRLRRGGVPRKFIDQKSLEAGAISSVTDVRKLPPNYLRDRAVRDAALVRAAGHCEYCGDPGFETISGSFYLESHHILPLSENGTDERTNVAAICPRDHREAHFGKNREQIRATLLKRIEEKERLLAAGDDWLAP
ncbi:HNH endonuclease [Paraburkholderia sp. SIMBA_061]